MPKIINSKTANYQPTQTENLVLDDEPTEGSFNGITSDAVAKVAGYIGDVQDVIPEGTTEENPLVNVASLKSLEEEILSINPPAAKTLRFAFENMEYNPVSAGDGASGTWKKVNTKFANIWDWTNASPNWTNVFKNSFATESSACKVIAAGDTSGIYNFSGTFSYCAYLKEVCVLNTSNATSINTMFVSSPRLKDIPLIDTRNVTLFGHMCRDCTSLEYVPLLDTSKATSVGNMFSGCVNVKSGALALYEQITTQTTPPSTYTDCFKNCGRDTTTGAAELAQIPASWGGTGPEPSEE